MCRVELGRGFHFKSTAVAAVLRRVGWVRGTGGSLDTREEATSIWEELMVAWARLGAKRSNQTLDIF